MDEIESAERALSSQNIERDKETLKNGKRIVSKRLKHIRIADREELGWQVVRFYESDDLADYSEDEKDLDRARREAKADAKLREIKRNQTVGNQIGNSPTLHMHQVHPGEGTLLSATTATKRDTFAKTYSLLNNNSKK